MKIKRKEKYQLEWESARKSKPAGIIGKVYYIH
jgi:hypothetical protein